jgi:hypothetical protein
MKCKVCGYDIDGRLKLSKMTHMCRSCAKKEGKLDLVMKKKSNKTVKKTMKKRVQRGG